jgi:hypothetical protein
MKRTDARLLLPALALLALLVPVAPASAARKPRKPAYVPALRLVVERAYTLNARRVALQHQRVRIRGIVRQYVPGQVMNLRVLLGKRRYVGRPTSRASERRAGRLLGRVQGPPPRDTARLRHRRRPDRSLTLHQRHQAQRGEGQTGLHVVFLQHRLRDLRYLVNLSGTYDAPRRAP